jgi:Holliday junction resolvase RusA-like endonuclease
VSVETELVLPYPPSANSYWRSAPGLGMVPSKEAQIYRGAVNMVIARSRTRPIFGPCRVYLRVYRPRAPATSTTALKVLLDALRGFAYLDDAQVVRIHADLDDDAQNPRVVINLEGERYATVEEAIAHRQKVAEANRKRKQTLSKNRILKAMAFRKQGRAR